MYSVDRPRTSKWRIRKRMENNLRIEGREESVFWTSSPTAKLVFLAMLPLRDSREDHKSTETTKQPATEGRLPCPGPGIKEPWVEKEPWRPTSTTLPSPKPFSPPGDLPNPGIKYASSALAGRFFTTEPPGKTANNVTSDFKPPMTYTLPWNFPKI